MKPLTSCLACLALAISVPQAANAQTGKIDGVEREARRSRDDGDSGSGPWLLRLIVGLFHGSGDAADTPDTASHVSALPAQSYRRFPYAGRGSSQRFVLPDSSRRRFGAVAIGRFDDASSALRSTSVDVEGASDQLYWHATYTEYREPKANEIDRLHDLRFGAGGVVSFLRTGYLTPGVAGRVICLDTGRCGGGFDGEIAGRIFPLRPFAVSAALRVGGLTWQGGGTILTTEANASAAILVGRIQVEAGWHWLTLGRAPAFAGPSLGARLWF